MWKIEDILFDRACSSFFIDDEDPKNAVNNFPAND
jgi:hypothetical protein